MKQRITYLLFAICLFTTGMKAQIQFWSDNFEDTGAPSTGTRTPSVTEFSFGGPLATAYFFRTTPSAIALQSGSYSGFEGSKIWAAEDIDKGPTGVNATLSANQQVTWTSINITGKTGLSFKGLFAANHLNSGNWEGISFAPDQDFLIVEYSIDGGAWVKAIAFYASNVSSSQTLKLDTNNDLIGDGADLTYAFTEYSANITGTGTTLSLRFNTSANGTGTEELAVDNFRLFSAAANTAPTNITLSASSINENVAANSTVGTLSSTDANAGNTFTYSLVSGTGATDNASFNINGDKLEIKNSPNFESKSSYSVLVRTTDQGGLTFDKQFTITITNVNEAPTNIALSATAINENVVANSIVGTFSTTDPDASNTFTYTLVSGTGDADNGAFTINNTTASLIITNSPDFETKSSYSVLVRTTDQGGLTFDKQFTITITNVNEAPTDIALSATAINENVAANSTVGTLSSTDPDASNTFTYTLVSGTGSTDNSAFNISGSNLRITNSPDYETKSTYTIRIRTTDQGSLFSEKSFTITVNNINDVVPVITSITNDTGDSATDYITKDTAPTVKGTAEPGTLVSLLVNGNSSALVGATVTTNGSGVFSFPFPAAFGTLPDAIATFGVTASLGGVTVSSATKSVTIDTKATIAVTTPIAGDDTIDNTEASNLTLSGTSTEVEVGRTVTITIGDGVNTNVTTTATITAGGAWTKSGIDISSLNNGSVSITAAVTDVAGNAANSMKTATLNKTTLGATDFNLSKETFNVYPNPVVAELTISTANNTKIDTIEVYSATGIVVQSVKNTNVVNLSSLSSGVYFVKIAAEGNQVIKKIIKE